MIRLNLLPDVKKEFIAAQRARARVITFAILITLVAIGLTVLAAFWVYGVQGLQKKLITDNINQNANALAQEQDLGKYLTVQNQLANIDALHSSKNDFSRVFSFLPKLNPAPPRNVRLNTIDLSGEMRTISMQGETANYAALTTFKDTLENATLTFTEADQQQTVKLFDNVVIDTSALNNTEQGQAIVSFTVTVTYNDKAFLATTQSLRVDVPNMETTQSTQGAPVFSESTAKPEGE